MPPPEPLLFRPRSVSVAQSLLWLQLLSLVCFGFMPVSMFIPAFMAMVNLPVFWLAAWSIPVLLAELALAIVYTVYTTRRIGVGDRIGRNSVLLGAVALIALAAYAAMIAEQTWAISGTSQWTLGSAVPSVVFQLAAWFCLYAPSAEEWFESHDERPATEDDTPSE